MGQVRTKISCLQLGRSITVAHIQKEIGTNY